MRRLLSFLISVVFIFSALGSPLLEAGAVSSGSSEQRERKIGEENYAPLVQAEGGPYTADAQVNRYMNSVARTLAAKSDRPDFPYEFVVINNSVPNAWSLPAGKIGINRGLLVELESEAELAAVLAHEIAHATEHHVIKRMNKQAGLGAIISVIAVAGGGDTAVQGASLGADLISAKFSRSDESDADRIGMEMMARAGYDPQGAVTLQETFVRLSKQRKSSWAGGLFASHPPSERRVRDNRKTAERLPKGGKIGKREYQSAMGRLIRSREAYERIDSGEEALRKKKASEALEHAKRAIAIEPKEPKAHSLEGRAYYHLGRSDDSIRSLTQAISLFDGFYFDHYARAVVYYDQEDYQAARRDLERSLAIVESTDAKSLLNKVNAKLR